MNAVAAASTFSVAVAFVATVAALFVEIAELLGRRFRLETVRKHTIGIGRCVGSRRASCRHVAGP